MNKKLKIAAAIGASLVLAGCDGLVDNPSASNSGSNSVSIGPSVSTSGRALTSIVNATKYDLKTGQSKELPGASLVVVSGDEKNIAIEQGANSAIIYAMHPGVVLLSNGSEKFELTISYASNSVLEDGNDYKQVSEGIRQESFRGQPAPYTIGVKNAFFIDMDVGYLSWKYDEKTSKYEKELVNVSISEASKHLIGDQEIRFDIKVTNETDVSKFVTVNNEDGTLQFSESAIGKEISVSVSASFAMNSVTQKYSAINDGYNAYDNDGFKVLFQDRNIEKINVLRSFEAKLDDSQYYFNTRYQKLVPFNSIDAIHEINYQGSIYFRYGGSNYGDLLPLEINGNYMQIDGSKLPEHVAFIKSEEGTYPDMPGFTDTQAGAIGTTETQKEPVVNPHAGIFRVRDFDEREGQETKLVLKNLSVLGASVGDDVDNPILHAGGFVGAFLDGIVAEFNNCNMQYLVYGAQINYLHGELHVKDSKIQDTWGPSLTSWMAKSMTIENSLLTKAGGPMLWAINCYGREAGANGSTVIDCRVDNRSELTNYMTTNSSWFKAYNMDITMQAQAIEATMNKAGYSIYKAGTNQLNFVGLVQHGTDYSTYPAGANFTIGGQTTFVNPSQFTDTNSQYTQFNPYGAGIFKAQNSLLLAFGQVIDQTIVNSADTNVVLTNYLKQLATKLGTYRAQGEAHLYLEVDALIGSELLAAVVEVTPLQAA